MLRASAITLLLLATRPLLAVDAVGVELFEKQIRPLLAEHCYQCHGPQRQRSGLMLSTPGGIRQGGDRGAVFTAGRPADSLLLRAISYEDADLRMPPKGKLSPQQIDHLTAWIKRGAPLPDETSSTPQPSSDFNLDQRRKHWSYQPVQAPTLPAVANAAWCSSPIDYFILSRLEAAGLSPAGPAESHALIRRMTFDLTGLPPTPDEVRAFEQSGIRNPKSEISSLVDKLLSSPRYGERWARHWLDLVRYGETLGFEFDYDLHHAWRYRDYVIRAFNEDLPYDQLVIEHLAGDLLPRPRSNPDGTNESIVATGFFWMGEGKQTPVDIRQEQADRIDNQIEVLGKALLGQTISCARCHDHKFDAISTRDYYALAGYLKSSRYQQAFLDPPERTASQRRQLAELKEKIRQQAISELLPQWRAALSQADRSLEPWVKALESIPEVPPAQGPFPQWFVTGDAFAGGSAGLGDFVIGDSPQRPIAAIAAGGVHSGLLASRLQGELRSATFTLGKPFIHYLVGGRHARLNLVIDGNTLIMNPMYGKLTITPESSPAWRTMPVDRWLGQRAYLELSDSTIPMHRLNPPPSTARVPEDGKHGYLALESIVFSDDPQPPAGQRIDVTDARCIQAVENWATAKPQAADVVILNWLLDHELLDGEASPALKDLLVQYATIDASIPAPARAPALADGTGEDEFIFLRGNYKTLGERARRGLPEVVAGDEVRPPGDGSGRLELARRLVDPTNPLLARVMVNRLWQHHFGEGLVRTPDDFGRMGQPPTHPELLDYLAAEFIRSGWSIKHMHRLMLLSSVYQMSASPPQAAIRNPQSEDSENRLLSHRNVRRLEAEAIRDCILAVSGRLTSSLHGPSVLAYLTPHMEGRGRPQTGPLDGEGRRSIYINARRNFLTPMFVAFDYPAVFTTIGRRGCTTVPSQALALMNDPFIIEQARHWAQRTLAEASSGREHRIESLYRSAFARSPTETELAEALAFLQRQTARYAAGPDDPRPWSDLCHVLINVKEFIFIE